MACKHLFRTATIIPVCIAIIFVQACAGNRANTVSAGRANTVKERQKSSSLAVESPQDAIYNGSPRPISFSYAGDDIPEIIYYPTLTALEEERGGSYTAPSLVGTYYVLVRCLHEETNVEFRIQRCPVTINAEEKQEAVFNGNPKRVQAKADPPVPLSYYYYPTKELRDAAIKAEEERALSNEELAEIFKGYRRVDRAPTFQGIYYVWIYFPGDKNHQSAQANIEFTILPAVPRR